MKNNVNHIAYFATKEDGGKIIFIDVDVTSIISHISLKICQQYYVIFCLMLFELEYGSHPKISKGREPCSDSWGISNTK